MQAVDALGFSDTETYPKRLLSAKEKSGHNEAVIVGTCQLNSTSGPWYPGLQFYGRLNGISRRRTPHSPDLNMPFRMRPLIIVSTSGGARMQESILSLMQMAKTSAALAKLT